MSIPVADQLLKADALYAEGRLVDAYNYYRAVTGASGLTDAQKEHVELAIARLTIAGVDGDSAIRFIAWLTFVAGFVAAALPLFTGIRNFGGPGLAFWWAVACALSGICSSLLMLRFADLVDRSRVTDARLVLLSAKLK